MVVRLEVPVSVRLAEQRSGFWSEQVTDSELRPGSRVWDQISQHVAQSFVEEWRRKYHLH